MFDSDLKGPKHATTEDCVWALTFVKEECRIWTVKEYTKGYRGGQKAQKGTYYTQGGWWQFEDDGSTYGVDPAYMTADGKKGKEE